MEELVLTDYSYNSNGFIFAIVIGLVTFFSLSLAIASCAGHKSSLAKVRSVAKAKNSKRSNRNNRIVKLASRTVTPDARSSVSTTLTSISVTPATTPTTTTPSAAAAPITTLKSTTGLERDHKKTLIKQSVENADATLQDALTEPKTARARETSSAKAIKSGGFDNSGVKLTSTTTVVGQVPANKRESQTLIERQQLTINEPAAIFIKQSDNNKEQASLVSSTNTSRATTVESGHSRASMTSSHSGMGGGNSSQTGAANNGKRSSSMSQPSKKSGKSVGSTMDSEINEAVKSGVTSNDRSRSSRTGNKSTLGSVMSHQGVQMGKSSVGGGGGLFSQIDIQSKLDGPGSDLDYSTMGSTLASSTLGTSSKSTLDTGSTGSNVGSRTNSAQSRMGSTISSAGVHSTLTSSRTGSTLEKKPQSSRTGSQLGSKTGSQLGASKLTSKTGAKSKTGSTMGSDKRGSTIASPSPGGAKSSKSTMSHSKHSSAIAQSKTTRSHSSVDNTSPTTPASANTPTGSVSDTASNKIVDTGVSPTASSASPNPSTGSSDTIGQKDISPASTISGKKKSTTEAFKAAPFDSKIESALVKSKLENAPGKMMDENIITSTTTTKDGQTIKETTDDIQSNNRKSNSSNKSDPDTATATKVGSNMDASALKETVSKKTGSKTGSKTAEALASEKGAQGEEDGGVQAHISIETPQKIKGSSESGTNGNADAGKAPTTSEQDNNQAPIPSADQENAKKSNPGSEAANKS